MRCLSLGAMALALVVAAPATARPKTPFEAQVLAMLNYARTNPGAYAQSLRGFRNLFHANYFVVPGRNLLNETEEGVAAVDEAIGFLAGQPRLLPIQGGMLLAAAAADHVAEQAYSGALGHGGRDGTGPSDRVSRRGGGLNVAEVIEYGAADAAEVVRQLIVDDGEPGREHRGILFDPHLRYAGISCGPHRYYGRMCVIDLSETSDGSSARRVRMAQSDWMFAPRR